MTRRRETLARENPKMKPGETKTPEIGDALRQLSLYDVIAARTTHYLGAFTPRAVTHRTRLFMRDDPDVAFGLAILRAPIINLRWSIESRDPEIKAFVEHVLRPRFRQLAMGASLAVPFGNQVIEKVWTSDSLTIAREVKGTKGETTDATYPNAWIIKRFKAIPHESLSFVTDPIEDDWIGVKQSNLTTGEVVAGKAKVALWSFRRQEVWGNLGGYPILNAPYEPWYWKAFTNFACNRYMERKGDPPAKARANKEIIGAGGKKTDGYKFMADQILKLKAGGVITLPYDKDPQGNYLFDYDYLLDDKRGDMFQQRIDKLGTQILRALWITDHAATTGEVGARAEAEVHADVMSQSLETIIDEFVDEVVNPQVVDDLVRFNFGEEALRNSGTRLVTSGISSDQRQVMKDVLIALLNAEQMLADGKKISLRDRLDAGAIAKELRIPLRSDEELEEMMENEDDQSRSVNAGGTDEEEIVINSDEENAVADQMIRDGILKDDGKEREETDRPDEDA